MAQQPSRSVRLLRQMVASVSTVVIAALVTLAPVALAEEVSQTPTTEQPVSQTGHGDKPADSPTLVKETEETGTPATSDETTPTAVTPSPTPTSLTGQQPTNEKRITGSSSVQPSDSNQDTGIRQNISSSSTSGDAVVADNTSAGDATSGQADATATVINIVHGASGLNSATPVTFLRDITGNIQGDITIDPSSLMTQPAGSSTVTINRQPDSSSSIDIINNVDLTALSGDANVAGNEAAGNATSGDATALANIINLVHSSVGSSKSFVGVINIHGNLAGDILVPSSFVNSLLASNGTAVNGATELPNSGSLESNVNITNNVNLDARSGNATVVDNESAGNATSGSATTNLTVFNLTGQQVVAKNSLLVFVNVLGKWVGMIVPAAPGSTSTVLGGGVVSNQHLTPGGDHQRTVNITNNVDVSARSGEANVVSNEAAGNARSGNATAGANILNLVHSSYNLDDWFGALFINVLGSWLGNFDIAPEPAGSGGGGAAAETPENVQPQPTGSTPAVRAVRVFQLGAEMTVKSPQTLAATTTISDAPIASVAGTDAVGSTLDGRGADVPDVASEPANNIGLLTAAVAAILIGLLGLASWLVRQRRSTI